MKKYRGYLLFLGEYQIYFIECVENISIFRVSSTSEIGDIFNTWDEIFFVFTEKEVNFIFIFYFSG